MSEAMAHSGLWHAPAFNVLRRNEPESGSQKLLAMRQDGRLQLWTTDFDCKDIMYKESVFNKPVECPGYTDDEGASCHCLVS